jgi:tetratricopeptide (TPR) repeat protein
MSIFQFLLFIISIIVFVLFFKQLFSGAFPKRGVDFEANRDNDRVGGMTDIGKSFSAPPPRYTRVEQLIAMADRAIEDRDFVEADKALSSALILEKENTEFLLKHGFVLINMNRLDEAKETYLELLSLDSDEDIAHASLANVLHQLGEDVEAIIHHEKSIELDSTYAPHYFNYANTLYDMSKRDEALAHYRQALKLDAFLEEAERMVKELS